MQNQFELRMNGSKAGSQRRQQHQRLATKHFSEAVWHSPHEVDQALAKADVL